MFIKILQRPKNEEDFKRLASIAGAAFISAIILQLISFSTEGVGVYKFLTSVFPSGWMIPVAIIAAIAAALVIELVINAGTYFVSKTLFSWVKGKLSFEIIELFLVLAIGGVVAIAAHYSIDLSKKNTNMVFQTSAPALPLLIDDTEKKTESNTDIARMDARHNTQKREIQSTYQDIITAETARFDAEIKVIDDKRKGWIDREQRTGNKYTSRIKAYESQITAKESDKAAAIAKIKEEEKSKLIKLAEKRDEMEKGITSVSSATLGTIAGVNTNKITIWNEWIEKYSGVFSTLAGYSVLIAILLIIATAAIDVKTERNHDIKWIDGMFETSLRDDISVWIQLVIVGNIQRVFRRANAAMIRRNADGMYKFSYDAITPDAKAPTQTPDATPTPMPVRNTPDATPDAKHFAKLVLSEIQELVKEATQRAAPTQPTEHRPTDAKASGSIPSGSDAKSADAPTQKQEGPTVIIYDRPTQPTEKARRKTQAQEREATEERLCLNCDADISHRTPRAKYCCDACRKDYHEKQKDNQ